ncbi:MAG: alpha/beta hydrolase, partial [Abditibacteriales bacterium]|nr:alpha/beta hydrolase [Abditibacteriales bacterium]MDW8368437.1 alpha/beta hydrolase [Abditibacteriales bacterium]
MNWVSFESGGRRLLGIWHEPSDLSQPLLGEERRSTPQGAFVFCAPFAEEEKCAHRVMVDAARALAQVGYAVLRFHYRGCGDSEGEFEEFTLEDWRQDIHAALHFVRSRASSLHLLGLRLGATLAAQVAEERDDVHRLILWEPIVNGRRYVAQNLLRKRLRAALTNHPTTQPSDATDFDGYLITDRLQSDLTALDLLAAPMRFGGRVLLVSIGAREQTSRFARLQSAYAHCDVVPVVT